MIRACQALNGGTRETGERSATARSVTRRPLWLDRDRCLTRHFETEEGNNGVGIDCSVPHAPPTGVRHVDAYRVTCAASPRRKFSSDTIPSTGKRGRSRERVIHRLPRRRPPPVQGRYCWRSSSSLLPLLSRSWHLVWVSHFHDSTRSFEASGRSRRTRLFDWHELLGCRPTFGLVCSWTGISGMPCAVRRGVRLIGWNLCAPQPD